MSEIAIAHRPIGPKHPPFIIAELSGNHNQSLERALKIVEAAAAAGATAVKLQTYTADTMTIDLNEGDFFIDDPESLWKGTSLYQLYQQASTPWDWHRPIFDRCRDRGMICFSTPFDATAVELLEALGAPAYKIASFENTDLPLIRRVASTGKPLLISTGMATMAELDEAVQTARQAGCQDLILLKCTSSYPATPEDTHLLTIPHMRDLFGVPVGLSDHTMGIGVAVASVALGAMVIEKHFTMSRADGGVDAAFSLEPSELAALVTESTRAWQSLGRIHYGLTERELAAKRFRRSLYVAQDMRSGEVFTKANLRAIRPGFGLAPKYYELLLGKKVRYDVKRGTPVSWELLG
ncbi:MAG: pseudaminic acid synthase [Cyanobacteria bacterium NC_groundwater_1444_Ag_S-0.65um_54_12]|nr:pseudaminic acid synthase [Cyanobacteria bacterium NC_groundwater_1444_Ag_S-0.65um_54_12]